MSTDTSPDHATGHQHSPVAVILVGLAAGLLGGLFGVGGGLLIVPALIYVLRYDQRLAHGTSLAAILPIAVASLATYLSTGNVDGVVAVWLALGAVAGALIGTKLLQIVPKRALAIAFIAVLTATALRLAMTTDAIGRAPLDAGAIAGLIGVGLISGILAGLLGVGGGVIMVPAMIVLFDMTPVIAKGTSVAVIIPTALIGTWRNRAHRTADVRAGLLLGGAGMISAVAGGLAADRMSAGLSNALFAALLVAVILRQLAGLRETPSPGAGRSEAR